MRIRELVSQRASVDKFTSEDFDILTKQVSVDPSRLILVGGQAIEVWGVYFDVPSPFGLGEALTEDADWLGGKLDAKWLSDLLKGHMEVDIQYAKDFEATPSTAIVYLKRGDRILLLDFLRTIIGPAESEVERLAVSVQLKSGVIRVLHPILCVHSRLANLTVLESKRNQNGIAQAQWSITIAKAYLTRLAKEGRSTAQIDKSCRMLAELAEYAGRFCYLNYGIDPLLAVDDAIIKHVGGKFETIGWPTILRRIEKKREKWQRGKERLQKLARNEPEEESQPVFTELKI